MPTIDNPVNPVNTVQPSLLTVQLDAIIVIDNPRTSFDEEALSELQASIAEHGIIEPLVGRRLTGNQYELICGERRLRAARALGLDAVPMMIHEDLSDGATEAMRVIENLHRRDLNAIEEARGYQALKRVGYTQRDIARQLHRSEPAISNAIRLLSLEQPIQDYIAQGKLTAGHGIELLRDTDPQSRCSLATQFAASGASVVSLRFELDWRIKSAKRVAEAADLSSTKPDPDHSGRGGFETRPSHRPDPSVSAPQPTLRVTEWETSATTVNDVNPVNTVPPSPPSDADIQAHAHQLAIREREGWLVSESDLTSILTAAFYQGYLTAYPRNELSEEEWQRRNYPLIGNMLQEYRPRLDRYRPDATTPPQIQTESIPEPAQPARTVYLNPAGEEVFIHQGIGEPNGPWMIMRRKPGCGMHRIRTNCCNEATPEAAQLILDAYAAERKWPSVSDVSPVNTVPPPSPVPPTPWLPAVGDIICSSNNPAIRARITGIACTSSSGDRAAADIVGLASGRAAVIHPDDWDQWELVPEDAR